MKPNAKVSLALAGIALAAATIVTVFLALLQGSPHWGQLLLFIVTAALGFASALLTWMVGARQLRVEKAQVTKSILKELASIEGASKKDLDTIREDVGVIRDQTVTLGERQRKSLNVVRSEASTVRDRLDAVIDAQKRRNASIGGFQHSLIGVGGLREELSSLRTLIETDNLSGEESAREGRDGLKELRTLVRRVVEGMDVVDLRDRKILNLLRGEIRDSAARSHDMARTLTAQVDKAARSAETLNETSVAVRKMHNFLRRDGSIQVVLDRFTAAERRMLAAVEAAGLDQADQVAELNLALNAERETISRLSSLGDVMNQGLDGVREEFDSKLAWLGADLKGLRDLVSERVEGEPSLAAAFNSKADELSSILEDRLRSLDDKLADLRARLDSSLNGVAVDGAESHEGELAEGVSSLLLPELKKASESMSRDVAQAQTGRLERYIKRQSIDATRQVEALMQLLPRVKSQLRRYPPSGWWALPADTLLFLSDYIEQERPRRVLEIGSGASTVWIGTFAKQVGAELVSLEHDLDFAQKTRALVGEYGLSNVATVHHAPLRRVSLDQGTFDWYDTDVVAALEGPFDLIIVDGPPEATGPMARMPALPVLEPVLSKSCLILLDDIHRPDEQRTLAAWLERFDEFEVYPADLMRTGVIVRGEK